MCRLYTLTAALWKCGTLSAAHTLTHCEMCRCDSLCKCRVSGCKPPFKLVYWYSFCCERSRCRPDQGRTSCSQRRLMITLHLCEVSQSRVTSYQPSLQHFVMLCSYYAKLMYNNFLLSAQMPSDPSGSIKQLVTPPGRV